MSGDPQEVEMAGHKPFSELRKDIDASPERLANVARERQEVEMDADRESHVEAIAAALDEFPVDPDAGVRDYAEFILDALLADGRWLLVHPDEMIRRRTEAEVAEWLVQSLGYPYDWTTDDPPPECLREAIVEEHWQYETDHDMTREDTAAMVGEAGHWGVLPAVEKENDQ